MFSIESDAKLYTFFNALINGSQNFKLQVSDDSLHQAK